MVQSGNPLYEQHCVFTGRLQKYTRKEAMEILAAVGGRSQRSVTKTTRFLILGTQAKQVKSSKQRKAEKNRGSGQNIELIPEAVFYQMLAAAGYGQISMEEWILKIGQ